MSSPLAEAYTHLEEAARHLSLASVSMTNTGEPDSGMVSVLAENLATMASNIAVRLRYR